MVRQARIFMAVLATVLLLAIAAGVFAGYQWRHAKLNAAAAEKNAQEAKHNLAKVFEESDNFCLCGLFKPAFANMIGRTPQITQIK
jgi:flagellar basal body-associated protein FliL